MKPDTTAARIRKLIEAHPGALTAFDLPALLPAVPDARGLPRPVTQRQVHNQLGPMLKRTPRGLAPLLVKAEDGTLTVNRPPIVRAYTEAEKAAAYRKSLDTQNARMRAKRAAARGQTPSPPRVLKTPEEKEATRRAGDARRNAERKAARHARGIVPIQNRALRIKDHLVRQQITAEAAQAINRRQLGLRDVPAALEVESVADWIARTGQEPERLAPGKVSKAAQFAKLENVA